MTRDNDLQLCIQCDIDTFEWLMRYINSDQELSFNNSDADASISTNENSFSTNELNMGNIIKLLIPAEFL